MATIVMCILPRSRLAVVGYTAIVILTISIVNTRADANSWLKPTSGNWEEPQWSQGAHGHNPSRLAIRKLPDSTVQLTVTADAGYNYGVLTSDDLINWSLWTNRIATNGTFSVVDPKNVNDWPVRRYYKAVLMQ